VLRGAGVVRSERRQRETVYALRDEHIVHMVREALAHGSVGQAALTVTTGPAVAPSSSSTAVAQPLR
jgi:hypothetical protein